MSPEKLQKSQFWGKASSKIKSWIWSHNRNIWKYIIFSTKIQIWIPFFFHLNFTDLLYTKLPFSVLHEVPMKRDPGPLRFYQPSLAWAEIEQGMVHCVQSKAVTWSTSLAAWIVQAILEEGKEVRNPHNSFISTSAFTRSMIYNFKYISQIQSFFSLALMKKKNPAE